jgi:hypothetical protein
MSIVLSAQELQAVTGYKRPADQLKVLHRLGFYRARIGAVTRQVVLERAHYDAICSGKVAPANGSEYRPRLRG